MAKVRYVQGDKASYLALGSYDPLALYFCTDTCELFKGADLYSDGIRVVENFASLPEFAVVADGILYFCKDTGCGYVLNENRDGWTTVVNGIDNETIGLNDNGMMAVKAIPVGTVTGLEERLTTIESKLIAPVGIATLNTAGIVKASEEIAVAEDGTMSIVAVAQEKVTGLSDRLAAIEQALDGGIHYRGAVDTFEQLPEDAQVGDLYEVRDGSGSEYCWNGTEWVKYGDSIDYSLFATKEDIAPLITKAEVQNIVKMVDYEVSHKPVGAVVNYSCDEIRVMCAADTEWALQNSGDGADKTAYYIGFKAYAPSADVVSFKEDLAEIITDETMYYFEGNDFAGTDVYGRKYSIVWLPVAKYDASADAWTYYGSMSSKERYIGWYYSVEWYDTDGVMVSADTIRINLSNEDCHTAVDPYYVSELRAQVDELKAMSTWEEM